jgi:thioredoxin:protein disulfide reductase
VLPMIPILSGVIVGDENKQRRSRAFYLSLAYVMGMAVAYAGAGVAAGLSGALLSTALQNRWVLLVFASLFVVLALPMFGLYQFQLPLALQNRIVGTSAKFKGGSLLPVFLLGGVSALIVSPCVAAPLAGALLFIGQTRNMVLGASALFAMALGMGVPLLLLGLSAGSLLPKAGPWMEWVKKAFGVVLLGVAISIIAPVVPDVVTFLLSAALFLGSAWFLWWHKPLRSSSSSPGLRSLSALAALIGVVLLVGGVSGSRDLLNPLAGIVAAREPSKHSLPFQRISSSAELDQKLATASGKYVMLDFYADWCAACKEMERYTFSDPRVQAKLSDTVLLQADVTANSAGDQALLRRFGLFGPPGIIFFDPSGKELGKLRVIGFEPSAQFLASLAGTRCC